MLPILGLVPKALTPIVLLALALIIGLVSLLSEEGVRELRGLRGALSAQKDENQRLASRVHELRSELQSITQTDRGLEKTAREELGLARPNEKVFIFEESN